MSRPPDPEMRRASFTRNEASPKVAKSSPQKQTALISVETQVAIYTLLPVVLLVGIIALIAGGRP
jgi:hypothetical protein